MAAPETWALVSNGVRARILRGLEDGGHNDAVELICKARSTHLRDVLADRSGRSFASDHTGRRSALEPGSDPVLRDMQDFAHETLTMLEAHCRAGDFRQLAIFAAPGMLGVLRREMPATLSRVVVLERAANLVQMPERDLRKVVLRFLEEARTS